jgi:hypothetical protein
VTQHPTLQGPSLEWLGKAFQGSCCEHTGCCCLKEVPVPLMQLMKGTQGSLAWQWDLYWVPGSLSCLHH